MHRKRNLTVHMRSFNNGNGVPLENDYCCVFLCTALVVYLWVNWIERAEQKPNSADTCDQVVT